jgi:hypothetical protein
VRSSTFHDFAGIHFLLQGKRYFLKLLLPNHSSGAIDKTSAHNDMKFKADILLFRHLIKNVMFADRLCGLVVGVPGCRQRSRVRFPELPEFLSSIESGRGFSQPCEHK